MKKCNKCGAILKDEDTRCTWCGAILDENVQATPEVPNNREEESLITLLKYADLMDDQMLFKTATCKLNGVGVAKNEREAFELFKVLAFRGNFDGMYHFALMLIEKGDNTNAYRWLKMASDGGHKPSRIKLTMDFGERLGSDNAKKVSAVIDKGGANFENIVEDAMKSIVMIEATKQTDTGQVESQGSGFIIDGGYVVTNQHVITNNPISISCRFEEEIDDKLYNLRPVIVAPEFDLAILEFTGAIKDKIASQKNLELRMECKYGEEVYTIGNPIGLGFSVSSGIVSNPKRSTSYNEIREVIQTDITANPGNSGGALLDKENNVLGVITYHPGDIEGGITMCVPSKYIVELLNRID